MKKKKCKVCGSETGIGFNINFKLVNICEYCATSIMLQQSQDIATKHIDNLKEKKDD